MVHTHARNTLDTEMRRLLAQLELISAIPACNYNATHGSDEHPGGKKPPGDSGYRTYAAWYGPPFHDVTHAHPGCRTDSEREDCIEAARRELEHLRHGTKADPETIETHEAMRARMLEETEGWSLQDVAQSHWRMSVSMVRRFRIADGRNAETGKHHTPRPDLGQDLGSRAREMKENGMSLRGIAMALGLNDKQQVQRLLRKAA